MHPALIDSHAHLDFDQFDQDRDAVMKRAREAGVQRIITIGTRIGSSRRAIELAQKHPDFLTASAGFHPLAIGAPDELDDPDVNEVVLQQHSLQDVHLRCLLDTGKSTRQWEELERLAHSPEVCAIGETGLDYYYTKDQKLLAQQRASFRRHLKLSSKLNKPIVVHIRDAFDDAFRITEEEGLNAGGVVHCFTGGIDECQRALKLGYFISLSGIVTFKSARALRRAVPTIPIDRILLETDSPYLAPTPHRGSRNEPAFVKHTAEVVAELMELPLNVVCEAATRNTYELFNLSDPT